MTVEVGMLMPPGICGEMGVVDPHKGIALGSVIADTMVECTIDMVRPMEVQGPQMYLEQAGGNVEATASQTKT